MCRKSANVLVLTQSTNLIDATSLLARLKSNKCVNVVLTTHYLHDYEREPLRKASTQPVEFLGFCDLLSDADMEECDIRAQELEHSWVLPGPYRLTTYYNLLNTLKNQVVLRRLNELYEVQAKHLMATDLGLVPVVWRNAGYSDYHHCMHSSIRTHEITRSIATRLSQLINSRMKILENMYLIEWANKKLLFLGSLTRLGQRLSNLNIIQPFLSAKHQVTNFLNLARQYLCSNTTNKAETHMKLLMCAIRSIVRDYEVSLLATSVHEYHYALSELASLTGLPLVILQDSYMPANLTSRYLQYFERVDVFLVWDRLSDDFFSGQDLRSELADLYCSTKLPLLEEHRRVVHKIVVVGSSAGEWTALKNRSDSDLLAETCADVAAALPQTQFIYRPHPFSIHRELEGSRAFKRIERFFQSRGIKNILISAEAKLQSTEFLQSCKLAIHPSSFAKDIQGADLILGEHSIGLIDAARLRLPFASVNATNRRNLFASYTHLGFPHCNSAGEILELVQQLECNTKIISQFNSAVKKYNENYAQ